MGWGQALGISILAVKLHVSSKFSNLRCKCDRLFIIGSSCFWHFGNHLDESGRTSKYFAFHIGSLSTYQIISN